MSFKSSEPIAISVKGLSKSYRAYSRPRDRLKQFFAVGLKQYFSEIHALRSVSFEIKKGEIVGIIGRNGSGKSTLLQLICGTVEPSTGTIEVDGKVAALLELGAGFNPEFTGRENVFLNAALFGLTQNQIEERFERIAAFADIGAFMDQPVRTYSSGMFVRLAFAVIAHVDADILVIDEALAVGDAYFVQKCMRFLRQFTANGTLLFVSHDTNAVVGLCSQALLLSQGELIRVGKPKDIAEFYLKASLDDSRSGSGLGPGSGSAPGSSEDSSGNDFKSSRAEILKVELLDDRGSGILTLDGGERVTLKVRARATEPITSPIIGFLVKDRLGQTLFGKNTYSANEKASSLAAGESVEAVFKFQFPRLAAGQYSVGVAFASGTDLDHEQLHWIHDATVLQVYQSGLTSGLFEADFDQIQLRSVTE